MAIPVANIYYLLSYAWDEFSPAQMTGIKPEDYPDTLHLFARLLSEGIRAAHKRGFETGYVTIDEPSSTIRGRILTAETMHLRFTQPQRAHCSFDEMSADVLNNQILRATLNSLLGTYGLEASLRADVRRTLRLMTRISDIELTNRLFLNVRVHQSNRLYSFLINVCRFFFESLQAQEKSGTYRFQELNRDPERMRRVFEKFVRNFYRRRQSHFSVEKERMRWWGEAIGDSTFELLPQMETDVTLRSAQRTVVVECKYTEPLHESRFFAEKIRAPHLYQLSSYLRNLESRSEPDRSAEGILLYPSSGVAFDQCYELHGHRFRMFTIDLDRPWMEIDSAMLALISAQQL